MNKIAMVAVGLSLCACQQTILSEEPGRGTIRTGEKVLVDDGRCPAGEVTQVTGGAPGVGRKYECITRPS